MHGQLSSQNHNQATWHCAHNAQLDTAEAQLMDSVNGLVKHKQIFGQAPNLEDLLDPVEEREDPD
ncbi:hypothetical protein C0989_011375 [Termitomyces sp. Mn162]|nr:hypothetical protein C0989_011375 [Termitomyces sp. Mn162]